MLIECKELRDAARLGRHARLDSQAGSGDMRWLWIIMLRISKRMRLGIVISYRKLARKRIHEVLFWAYCGV